MVLFFMPLAYVFLLSFANNWRYPLLLPENFSLETWTYLFKTDYYVGLTFGVSILLSISVAILATCFGFFMSKSLSTHSLKSLFIASINFSYAFSPVVYAFCLNFLFIKLNLIGTLSGVVLAQCIIAFPFSYALCMQHWTNELLNLDNVVLLLGGSRTQSFFKVILPLSKNILLICFFQTFLISWFEYGLTSIIGLGKIQTLTLKTYQFIGESNIYFAAMSSVLLVFPPLLLFWFNRQFVFRKM